MRNLRLWLLVPLLVLAGCRTGEPVLPSTPQQVVYPDPDPGEIRGFFVLNEGNMGSNKASLDYFDYETGKYTKNIFPERNPGVVRELGDVGNDLQIHGDRLYAVINCSHFVEVMDVRTARHIGVVSIPNCRYIVFKDGYAYVSSYAGPVQVDPASRLGYVAKVDLATLQVVDECTVGYQPEEMVIAGDKLYVANSGGYRVPDYDRTVSVVDLGSFTEVKKIDIAPNLHRMELDQWGQIWVSSRGDRKSVPSRLYVIDSSADEVTRSLDLPVGNITRHGDRLYVGYMEDKNPGSASYAVVDVKTREVVERNFIRDGTQSNIAQPYGVAVNPATGAIIVTDAKDYVTPGRLHCYTPDGHLDWSATTGDIPAHIAFTTQRLLPLGDEPPGPDPGKPLAGITAVFEFMPAAGQYVNASPPYEAGDTQETMNRKALDRIGSGKRSLISLGGFGGYVVVGFDHTIENVAGRRDFRVLGNAFDADPAVTGIDRGGSSEPGVIAVARDANGNGLPDDTWYEIAGSAHRDPAQESWYAGALAAGNDVATIAGYEITWHRPTAEPTLPAGWADYIRWEDNRGGTGYLSKNEFHSQSWWPLWVAADSLTFRGTRLPQNAVGQGGYFVLNRFLYGYADNAPNSDDASAIDIDWAVDADGAPANLSGVDFVRIHTGVNQQNGHLGECSAEISGVEDLHILGITINAL